VGAGSSLEAEFTLVADVPAGEWRLVADGVIVDSVDVRFELLWRRAGRADVTLGAWDHHFDKLAVGFDAQAFEATSQGPAVEYVPGDQLVFRYAGTNSTSPMAYIPNGNGALSNGRIPFVTLP
jgi:hypothetical protein